MLLTPEPYWLFNDVIYGVKKNKQKKLSYTLCRVDA